MLYLLNPRMWIGAAIIGLLAVTHMVAYRTGKVHVQAKWDKEKVVQLEAARKQEADFRAKEQKLIAAKQESEARYVELKKRFGRDAAAAGSELGRLRDALSAANEREATSNSAACSRANGGARLERELLGSCAAALTTMAAEADRLEAVVVGLQSYVRSVCLSSK